MDPISSNATLWGSYSATSCVCLKFDFHVISQEMLLIWLHWELQHENVESDILGNGRCYQEVSNYTWSRTKLMNCNAEMNISYRNASHVRL